VRVWRIAAACAALIAAAPALAHEDNSVSGGFVAGLLHPLAGADHLLAMVAVGLWGAYLGRPLIYVLPVVFPTVMAVGGILGMAGLGALPVELGIAASVLLLGTLVAASKSLPVWAACLIVGLFGLFHGFAHGQELPVSADPVGYSAGFMLSTGSLHLAGIALGLLTGHSGPLRNLPRILGAGIAVAGLWFLYRAATG
jgi:urease accessory protein